MREAFAIQSRKHCSAHKKSMINFLFHLITAYIIPGMLLGFALCFFFQTVPFREKLKEYTLARRIMGCNYIVYCAALIAQVTTKQQVSHPMLDKFIILSIGSTQAFFFTCSLTTLVCPRGLNIGKICREIITIVVVAAIAIASSAYCRPEMQTMVFYGFSVFYVLLIVRYVLIFRKNYTAYKQNADNFFSDNERQRLQWTATSFYSATALGVLALVYAWYALPVVSFLFMATANVYYAVFGIHFLNYVHAFPAIEPVINEPQTITAEEEESNYEAEPSDSDKHLMETIDNMMENEKLYTSPSLSIENLSVLTGKSHRVVSGTINRCRHMNFKTNINKYRVDEAARLIESGWLDQHTMEALAKEAGFGNRTNLYRVFKRYTGVSPSDKYFRDK